MFIRILQVLTDHTKLKVMTLSYLCFIPVKSATFKNSEIIVTDHQNVTSKRQIIFQLPGYIKLHVFSEHQDTRNQLKSSKLEAQVESHRSSSMKSYLKVMPFSLGENNFAGLATALICQYISFPKLPLPHLL